MKFAVKSDWQRLVVTLAIAMLGSTACARQAPPLRVPPDLPHTMPSEEEASRVRPGAGEAIPTPGSGADSTRSADSTGAIEAPDASDSTATHPAATAEPTVDPTSAADRTNPADSADPTQPAPSSSDTRPQQPGFRVQIFAGKDSAAAEALAERCRQTLAKPVYVVMEGVLYKVRVGDCLTRAEANVLHDDLFARGHPQAFVVETLIYSR